MEQLLELQNLEVKFHTLDGVVHAVNGVSYYVNQGETLGIVGESGCGKSVSVLSIMRLIPDPPGKIAGGKILFHGENMLDFEERQMEKIRGSRIGMVFQDPMTSLNPVLTIGKQISEAMVLHQGISKKEADQKAIELLSLVGIPNPEARYGDYPHQFSGGMRQRVMIAMALSCSPEILIADEPTTALDVTIQAQIIDLTKKLRDQLGMAVIWITHDLAVVAELADRVVVMYAGYIVEQADVFRLFENPRHPYTLALLESLPRVDNSRDAERLATIPGFPPDGLNVPPGCPLAPRCGYTVDRCLQENPQLQEIETDHQVACWVDVSTGKEL
ncbi:MAG: ABC transporter ATP-binding protein [Anaerolineales bacterium]